MTCASPTAEIIPAQASPLFTASSPSASTVLSTRVTRVAVLGSTGSIGKSTLEVIGASGGKLAATALSAHASLAEAYNP